MKRKEARKFIPLIEAFADGKTLQYRLRQDDNWGDMVEPVFGRDITSYRIKPDPPKEVKTVYVIEYCRYDENDWSYHSAQIDFDEAHKIASEVWTRLGNVRTRVRHFLPNGTGITRS